MIQNKTIVSALSLIIQNFPDNKAVIHNKKSITYRELDFLSDSIASEIKKINHIKKSIAVAMYMPAGIEAVISMLGILKAGYAYLPMDINDPLSRIEVILENAQPDIIITLDEYKINFKDKNIELLIVENVFDASDFTENTKKNHFNNKPCKNNRSLNEIDKNFSNSFAYIIYTSGSTGKPKGIPVKHKAVINLLDDFQQRSPLDSNDRCSLWTSLNFDVSVYEIWSALLSGATLFIPEKQVRADSDRFIQWLKNNRITSAYIPPFMISDLALNQTEDPVLFKRILTGVEPIPESLLCTVKRNTPGLCLINGYGPAEATVCATLYEVPDYPANPGNTPIGKPVKNLEVYILDESGTPVRDGEKGEIYIAGIQVAEGYLNNTSLSAKSFLKNPFTDNLPGFMYKTGDIGTKLRTGDIIFGGRKDFQIKLRGFRIEPGEIENIIKEFPGISQAAVVLKENKTKRQILTAYIDSTPDKKELIKFLKARLPGYMVPSAVISLEKMPLTSNDKIDKKNLIQRQDLDLLDKKLPETEYEKKLAKIWEEFFGIKPIYKDDDFLLFGGDSISGIKILSRVNRAFSTDIDINTLFQHSKLKDFAEIVRKNKKTDKNISEDFLPQMDIDNEKGYVPLLDDQDLNWIFEQIYPGTSLYHIPLVYYITGKLNYDLLKQSIEIIKKRHVALRSVFLIHDNKVIQKQQEYYNGHETDLDLPSRLSTNIETPIIQGTLSEFHIDTKDDTASDNCSTIESIHYDITHIDHIKNSDNLFTKEELKNKWILEKTRAVFNLETGPVFRTDILITGEHSLILCFTFHHIIFDGWSAGLFIKELGNVYNSLLKGESIEVSEPEFSFHDYIPIKIAEVERSWKTAEPFFKNYLKDLPENSKNLSKKMSGACFPVKIDIETYNKIKKISLENKTSPFTVLLSLFQILLFTETGQNDQITGIAYAGREKIATEQIIGFLINTLVVRNIINTEHSFVSFLGNVKKTLEKVFRYKNIPFQKINHLCQETSQREKVFESLFLMQTMDFPPLNFKGAETEYMHIDMGKANCDITLELFEKESGLDGWFEYRTDVFNEKQIEQIRDDFIQIVKNATDHPGSSINNLLHLNSFPISPMQHGIIMESLRAPQGAGSYIEQIVFDINQDIDIKRFTKAWEKIIKHHEIMRLGFKWQNLDRPLQYIIEIDHIDIEIKDWSTISKSEADEFMTMFLQADRRLGFSLSKPPLFRIALLKTDENQYTCVWSFHYAIADEKSMVYILKDLFLTYNNPEAELGSSGSFKDYISWLNKNLSDSDTKKFWTEQLKGFTKPVELPFNLQKQYVIENRRQEYSVSITTGNQTAIIPPESTSALKKMCEDYSITINSLLMGVWAVLLSHYTGENDIVFGATSSVRHWRENEAKDTGLYINTLPVRIKINPQENLKLFLIRVRDEWLKTKEFVHSSLADIHAWSEVKGSTPLFDIFFACDYSSIDAALEKYKGKISCKNISLFKRTHASIFLTISGTDNLSVIIEYDRRRFDNVLIKQILGHFITFVNAVAENFKADSMQRLKDVSILTDVERNEIFSKLNTDKIHTRPDSCIHHLIDIQASVNKEAIAVTDHKKTISYEELNTFANQIANYLIKHGAAPETKIVLLLEQTADLIAVILGVLKSGAAYVPLDPGYPDERVNYIIEDSEPEIIITSKIHEHRLDPKNAALILLDREMSEIKKMDTINPGTNVTPENIAYIIYTSGSTGKPKGVIIEHGALVAFTRSASEIYDIRPNDRVLQFASISFDASIEEIFPTLFSGAALVMKPRGIVHTPFEFINFCFENRLSVVDLPTSYWHMIVDEIDSLAMPEDLRLIIIGGDEANPHKVEKWNKSVPSKIRLINTYGPTETTVAVTWADISSGYSSYNGKVSIGLPFPNVSLCILNQFQQPALPGTMGELCIGGAQTARGYLNRGDLTSESFVKFENINEKMIFFKTGDNVEMLAGNGIIFYGRLDRQIKIRGFRVEPGEIEKTAMLHRKVAECAVAISKDKDNNINFAAFLVPDQKYKDKFSIKEFKSWLLTKLPEYMVPPLLIIKDFLPYTSSGKIDYKTLEIPQLSRVSDQSTDLAIFNNPYEKDLKKIWESILNLEVPGPNDSFFDIGGSSLYAIKLVSAIEKKFKISIPVIAVFKSSTIRELARIIEKEIRIPKLNPHRLISKKGNKTPIILIGNSVGAAQGYKKADLKEHPFYHAPVFIHFYSVEKNETISLDIWQLAQKCINDIMHVFPSGPYIIMGECSNAIVAHEVACQLTNMNKEVELLIVLDEDWEWEINEIYSSGAKGNNRISSFIKKQIHEFNQFGILHIFKKIISRIKYKIKYYYSLLDGIKERLYPVLGMSVPEAVQFRLMENVFYRACEANPYMPLPYYGPTLMLYSKNWIEKYSPKLGKYYKGEVKKIQVNTTHHDWFKPEQIEIIIKNIEEKSRGIYE